MLYINRSICILTMFTAINPLIMASKSAEQKQTEGTQPIARQVLDPEENYTGDKILGDPSRGVQVLKRIYQFTQIYRQRHAGAYPVSSGGEGDSLFSDMVSNTKSYGFSSLSELMQALDNPDNQYVDDLQVRQNPHKYILFFFPRHRLDGSLLGSPKFAGTKDLLSYTSIYYHRNGPSLKRTRKQANPVGIHLVLWDDDQVERVAYDEALYVSQDEGFSLAFRGQAGLPVDCITYQEFWTQIHHLPSPPIGYPVKTEELDIVPDNGGIESLVWLGRLLSIPWQREQIWDALNRNEKEFSLSDVQSGAQQLGLPLQKQKLTFDELKKRGTPAILYLNDSKRIVTLANLDDKEAIVIDQGMTRIVSREVLQKRYGGEALIAEAAANAPKEAPRVLADDPIRVLEVKDRAADIKQDVTITNSGKSPLTLQIERPIPGGKEADLSSDTIAPGQSATLSLTLKWRDILKGDTQNVFVFLRTNDPLRPRLQLGFKLQSPQSQNAAKP